MHELEGPDYVVTGGDHRAKDTDPPTKIPANDYNAINLSLKRVVENSGEALKADGTADLADNWQQLTRAVRTVGNQLAPTTFTITGSTMTLSPALGTHAYALKEGSNHVGAVITLDGYPNAIATTPTAHLGRRILITNETTSVKYILGNAEPWAYGSDPLNPAVVRLAPGRSCEFYAVLRFPSVFEIYWEPVDSRDMEIQTISCKLFSNSNVSSAFNVEYQIDHRSKRTFLSFPVTFPSITLTVDNNEIKLDQAGGAGLPPELVSRHDGRTFFVYSFAVGAFVKMNSVGAVVDTAGEWRFKKLDASNFGTGVAIDFALNEMQFVHNAT